MALQGSPAMLAHIGSFLDQFRAVGANLGLVTTGRAGDEEQEWGEQSKQRPAKNAGNRRPSTLGCSQITNQRPKYQPNQYASHRMSLLDLGKCNRSRPESKPQLVAAAYG